MASTIQYNVAKPVHFAKMVGDDLLAAFLTIPPGWRACVESYDGFNDNQNTRRAHAST